MDKNVLAALLAALFAASEALGLSNKIKENSVAQVVFGFISKIFGK